MFIAPPRPRLPWAHSDGREACERRLGPDAGQVLAPDPVVGELLGRAQRRLDLTGTGTGTGTGVGIGSTSLGQTTAQNPVGQPTSPPTTPGGPPNANPTNMSGIGGNSTTGR